jgi:porin
MKTKTYRKWTVLVMLFTSFVSLSWTDLRGAETETAPKSDLMKFLEQDYLFGTWGGGRTWLSEHGVDFEFFYIGSMPSVISGGREIEKVYQGLLAMTMDLDSKKLAGYDGGHFHAGGLWLHGEKPFSDAFIGDLNKVNLVDYPNGARLWELWYEQRFLGTNVGVKAGLMSVDQDFITPEVSSRIFVNQTFFFPTIAFNIFDLPGFPVGFHALPSSPLSALGVRLRVDPSESFYVQAAVYDGYPDMQSPGTRINLNSEEGALSYFEAGYRWNQGKDDTGLSGNVKVGGYYHTDDFYDNYNTVTALVGAGPGPTTHSGNYGLYATADQTLYREGEASDPAKQGLGVFVRGGWAPKDRNLVEWALDGGLVYRGLIPTRDWDALGISAAWMWMSEDIARAQRVVNTAAPGTFSPVDYEGLMEITYKAQLTAWWTLQPSFQWVAHPGGSDANRNAWAFVLMTTLRF